MAALRRSSNGAWRARKRLPHDVREEYGTLYDRRYEELFYAAPGTKEADAKRQFGEWLAEVEGRIAAIRAQRIGEGISVTRQQARALAGEWYSWFIVRHPLSDAEHWEAIRDRVAESLKEAAGDEAWEGDPRTRDELWRADENLRKAIRPVLADVGETAQFLHSRRIVLKNEARDLFLDNLYDDLGTALRRLIREARGDYRPDNYAERFPNFEAPDTGETPLQLFEAWVIERQPAHSTIESWKPVFRAMLAHFEGRSAGSIRADEAQEWIKSLVNKERKALTVRKTWLAASKRVFGWAAEQRRVANNPFGNIKITVPRLTRHRETQAFKPQEWRTILKASLAIADTSDPFHAAQRWVPWLCAYTGARPGEITQLRKADVFEQDAIYALRFTPAAGSIKAGKARVVPLHEHLVAQGFLTFIQSHSEGPLFYKPDRKASPSDPLKAKKSRSAQVRQRLAKWVRDQGVDDPELQPNHAWRHTFKQIADRVGISERMSDTITGHAHKSVGAGYGAPTLEDMAEALKRFPRYEWGGLHKQP